MSERPGYILHLRPEPGVDGPLALRHGLKRLLRDHGLRCTRVERCGFEGAATEPELPILNQPPRKRPNRPSNRSGGQGLRKAAAKVSADMSAKMPETGGKRGG